MNPIPDPVIDEIREIRHHISAMCDHDPAKLVAYFQQIQEQYRDRLITSPRFAPPKAVPQVDQTDPDKTGVSPSRV
jgi:hypothetical protein